MKTLAILLFAAVGFAQNGPPNVTNARLEVRAFSGELAPQMRAVSPTWFGYAVKTARADHESCCWENSSRSGCWLEGDRTGAIIGTRPNNPVQLEGSDEIAILFRVENNVVEKVQVYSLTCPLDAGGLPFVWLTGVPANASLAYLEKLVKNNSSDHLTDGAIFAIAQHDDPQADSILERLAQPSQPENVREKVSFWLGTSRGARGVEILKNMLAGDPSEQVRDKVIFALSISKQPEALNSLIQAAKADSSPHVRGQAIFWLAQKAGKRASATIIDAIENDPDTQVKKRAVFALSQLPRDEGVPKLIEVARSQKNPEVRKQAFFWLGQSHDPRALAFIEEILAK